MGAVYYGAPDGADATERQMGRGCFLPRLLCVPDHHSTILMHVLWPPCTTTKNHSSTGPPRRDRCQLRPPAIEQIAQVDTRGTVDDRKWWWEPKQTGQVLCRLRQ